MQRLECERMFVAVMEQGSFAKAAARLGTSSGQASKLVSRLEQDLGVRLLNRTTRALSPTEVGQAYYERIRLVLEELVRRARTEYVSAYVFATLHGFLGDQAAALAGDALRVRLGRFGARHHDEARHC